MLIDINELIICLLTIDNICMNRYDIMRFSKFIHTYHCKNCKKCFKSNQKIYKCRYCDNISHHKCINTLYCKNCDKNDLINH